MSTENVVHGDLPALFRAVEKASNVAQSQFGKLTASQLGLWVIAAMLGSFALSSTPHKIGLAIASAVVLILTIVITVLIVASTPGLWILKRDQSRRALVTMQFARCSQSSARNARMTGISASACILTSSTNEIFSFASMSTMPHYETCPQSLCPSYVQVN